MKTLPILLLSILIISSCSDQELNPTSAASNRSSSKDPGLSTASVIAPLGYHEWPGVGNQAEGAGVALADLNNNGILDLVFMANDIGNPLNQFRWYVGYDLGVNGEPTSTSLVSGQPASTDGRGNTAQGAGVALGDIDRNGTLDILLMHYDVGSPTNEFRFKIGWNINAQAVPTSWTIPKTVPGLGNDAIGANVALADLDGNGILDMVLIHRDSQTKQIRYKIGSNLSTAGEAQSWVSPAAPGGFSNVAAYGSVGVGFYKLPGENSYRGVFAAYDKYVDTNQQPYLYFNFIRTNGYMSITGPPNSWEPPFMADGPGGTLQEGAGLAFGDINRNGTPDMLYMGYDAATGPNTFRYYIAFDMSNFGQ